jgi:hypothetical protein
MDVWRDGPEDPGREMDELELALFKRGVDQRLAGVERCSSCGRTPLIGERVYPLDERGAVACELCRALAAGRGLDSRLVHGPEFGHTIRILDHRQAA